MAFEAPMEGFSPTFVDVTITGDLTIEGDLIFDSVSAQSLFLGDDDPLKFGNTSGSPNASLQWETADANANALVLSLPAGGGVDVPVFAIGDDTALGADLGLFDGVTDPTLAVLSDDASKAIQISHDGTDGSVDVTTGAVAFPSGTLHKDNITATFGSNTDWTLQYDETTTDSLLVSEGAVGALAVKGSAISSFVAAGDTAGNDVYIETQDGGVMTAGGGVAGGLLNIKMGDGSDAFGGSAANGGAGGGLTFVGGTGGAGDGAANGGAGGAITFQPGAGGTAGGSGVAGVPGAVVLALPTVVDGGTNDVGLNITQTINATEAAGGSDKYNMVLLNPTTTDLTGYDEFGFIEFQDGGTRVAQLQYTESGRQLALVCNTDFAAGNPITAFNIDVPSGGAGLDRAFSVNINGSEEFAVSAISGNLTHGATQFAYAGGSNTYVFQHSGTTGLTQFNSSISGGFLFNLGAATTGSATNFEVEAGTSTGITAGTERLFADFDTALEWTWATSVPTTQRSTLFRAPLYDCDTGSQTITDAVTVDIAGVPTAQSGNLAITNAHALRVGGRTTINQADEAMALDINYSATTYVDAEGVVDLVRSGNLTGASGEQIIDLQIIPSFTLTEPGSGQIDYWGANIDLSGISVTAAAGTSVVAALRLAASGDTDVGTDLALYVESGRSLMEGLVSYGTVGSLTIASGSVAVTKSYHTLAVEGGAGAGADQLDTATGGSEGDILILKTTTSGVNDTVTIANGTGADAFILDGGANFSMNHVDDRIKFIHNGTEWVELSRSDNS